MKTLTHICEETDQEFKRFCKIKNEELEKLAKEWIGDLEIIGYNISIKGGVECLFISAVMRNKGKTASKYYLFRFFPIGGFISDTTAKWQVSVDVNEKGETEFIQYLLTKL